jgi:hypothetical protein
MIEIFDLASQQYLVLDQSLKVTFDWQNPLFLKFDEIKGSYSYQFKVPYNPNFLILGDFGMPHSTEQYQGGRAVHLRIQATYWIECDLVIESALAGQYYELKIDVDFGDFKRLVGDRKLTELIDATYDLPLVNTNYWYYKATANFTPPTIIYTNAGIDLILGGVVQKSFSTFVFVPGNPNPLEISDAQCLKLIADWLNNEADPPKDYQVIADGSDMYVLPNADNVVYNLVLRKGWTEFALPGQNPNVYFESINFSQITYQQVNPVPKYADFCFPQIYAPNFYDKKNEDYQAYLNLYQSGAYAQNNPVDKLNRYAISAQIFVFAILDKICEAAGYTWEGELKLDTELANLLIYSPFADDASRINSQFKLNTFARTIRYTNHLPDMTVNEFLTALQGLFLYYKFDYQAKKLIINFRKNKITNLVAQNWQEKGITLQESNVIKKKFKLQYKKELNESNFFAAVEVGSYPQTETFDFGFGTLPYDALSPAIDTGKGNSELFELGTNNGFPLRFLLYRGIINGVPTATAAAANEFDYALTIDGAKGIYEVLAKDYLNFLLNNKSFEGKFWLDLDTLLAMTKQIDEFELAYDNIFYLLESARFELANQANPFGRPIQMKLLKNPL